jgi:LPS sulfotransferase NodH
MTGTVRFMILMPWGRVGSNLVMDIVAQTSAGKFANETFNALRSTPEQMAWYDAFYEIGAMEPSSALIGSKQSLFSIRNKRVMRRRIKEDGLRIIRMRRDNIVRAALSQIRARQYAELTLKRDGVAQWGVKTGDTGLGASEINFDILIERTAKMQATHDQLMAMFKPGEVLDIEYDQVNHDLNQVVRDVRRYLSLDPDAPYEILFAKATPDDARQVVSNYGELVRRLKDTPYAGML